MITRGLSTRFPVQLYVLPPEGGASQAPGGGSAGVGGHFEYRYNRDLGKWERIWVKSEGYGGGGGMPMDLGTSPDPAYTDPNLGTSPNPSPNPAGVNWGKWEQIGLDVAPYIYNELTGDGGGGSGVEKYATAPFLDPKIQAFLPPSLRFEHTGWGLQRGIQNILHMMQNPGMLNPNIAQAIAPRMAAESERLAQNYRGMQANQAGAAARSNLPVSIKNALSSALDVAQDRAQRGARRQALMDSEELRRDDLNQTWKILDALLQFTSSGRGQAVSGLASAQESKDRRRAADLDLLSGLADSARDWRN